MPILDVDFPSGIDKETAAAAATLATVELPGPDAARYFAPAQSLFPGSQMAQPGPSYSQVYNDDPYDMSWFQDQGRPGSASVSSFSWTGR
jgi:hypothetical protein